MRIAREPLVHFLVLGALLFAVYGAVAGRERDPDSIVIGTAEVDLLTAVFERTWGHPPTPEEVRGLVDHHVREEIFYREGVAMGLDRDDPLIRKRMRQKVEFLAESLHGFREPDEAALQAYFDSHRERYVTPVRVTFRQVYLGTVMEGDVAPIVARLDAAGDADVSDIGRPTQLDASMESATSIDVARVFGEPFAAAVLDLAPGAWRGPIPSSYGLHLVRIDGRKDATIPALADVRETVKRDWQRDDSRLASEKYYAGIRTRYAVRVDDARVAPSP
jgi:hypothetical protein